MANASPAPETLPLPGSKGRNRGKGKSKGAPRPRGKAQGAPERRDHLSAHATAGIALCAILSAGLNGYANAQHATVPWAGWALGTAVPLIVLMLAKVAGGQWRKGAHGRAYLTAGSGAGLLALSVWHCATSLSLLTGSHIALSVPMAIGIDCGLVAMELAVLLD